MTIPASRRLAVAAVLCALAAPTTLFAQAWQARPVTIIVPFPAGGNIGATVVAKAAPDGYTLLFATPGPVAQNRLMYKSMPYDPDKDLQPIVLIANSPLIVTAKAGSPFKTLKEMVAFAKANPGKLNAGVPGQGTLGHITSELLQSASGAQYTNVPYRGTTPLITDLLGGQIDLAMDFMTTYVPLVKDGKVRALAITSSTRSPALPDVPTVIESGVANFEATAWYSLLAPTGTPNEVIQKVNAAVNDWLKTPKANEVLATMAMLPNGGTPEQLKAYIAAEVAKWGPVIKAANIQF